MKSKIISVLLLSFFAIKTNGQLYQSSDNIGVGTSTPSNKFEVIVRDRSNAINLINTFSSKGNWPGVRVDNYDGTGFNGYPVFELSNIKGQAGSPLPLSSGAIMGLIGFSNYAGNNIWGQSAQIYAKAEGEHSPVNGVPGRLVFSTTSLNNTVPQVRMVINSNGNLGLGTDNPVERFQLGDRLVLTDGGWKGICSNIVWDANRQRTVRIVDGAVSGIYYTEKGNTIFTNGPSNAAGTTLDDVMHAMVVYSSGQVGIGTNSYIAGLPDQTTKFFVEGGLRARKVKVDQNSWADFVFQKGYRLPSVDSVERYIQQNQHLPSVPTENEVKENGIDVSEMNKLLLQKIEELTLYIIDQNKQIKDQQKRIEVLENRSY